MRRDKLDLPKNAKRDRPKDLWICGRTCGGNGGGTDGRDDVGDDGSGAKLCIHGPSRRGRCPLGDACRPKLTWAGKKRRVAYTVIALSTFTLLVVTRSSLAPSVFKPGELTRPHAQILAGKLTSQRCGACHETAATDPLTWITQGSGDVHSIGQTDRCMTCHHPTIDREFATHAHNLSVADRRQRTRRIRNASLRDTRSSWTDQLSATSLDQNSVQCGVCHREHQGPDGDLLSLSDSQCQTCHSRSFGRFATSHPDWNNWPYGRGGHISFNHATHAAKHFPATLVDGVASEFNCQHCHPTQSVSGTLSVLANSSPSGEVVRSVGYEAACASCHDEALNVQSKFGLELVSLPILPAEVANTIDGWPESATGFFDGKLSPLAELLIRGDATSAQAIRNLPEADFSRLSPQAITTQESAALVADGIQSLLNDLATQGQPEWSRRAREGGVSATSMLVLSRTLSPQFIESIYRGWFSQPPVNRPESDNPVRQVAANDDDLLGDELLGNSAGGGLLGHAADDELLGSDPLQQDLLGGGQPADPLAIDPLSDPLGMDAAEPKRDEPIAPSELVASGGWYHDPLRKAITYRSGGHADSVMIAWLETLAQLPDSDPVKRRALKTPAVAACASCHAGALQLGGGWKAETRFGLRSEFTKFRHRPHLNVSSLGDCRHCHQLASPESAEYSDQQIGSLAVSPASTSAASRWHSHPVGDFLPLGKESCAACHLPTAAGDNCVTCHRYHIDLR